MKVIITDCDHENIDIETKSCLMRGLNLNSHVPEQKMK